MHEKIYLFDSGDGVCWACTDESIEEDEAIEYVRVDKLDEAEQKTKALLAVISHAIDLLQGSNRDLTVSLSGSEMIEASYLVGLIKSLDISTDPEERQSGQIMIDLEKCRKAYEAKYYKSHFAVWNGEEYETKKGCEKFEKQTILVNNGWQYWKAGCIWQAENSVRLEKTTTKADHLADSELARNGKRYEPRLNNKTAMDRINSIRSKNMGNALTPYQCSRANRPDRTRYWIDCWRGRYN